MTKISGLDVGTMNLVSAVLDDKNLLVKSLRNMFIEVDPNNINVDDVKQAGLECLVQKEEDEERIYVIGEDSFRFSQIFGTTPRRPMKNGVISSDEIDAIDIVTLMIQNLLGRTDDGYCVYSIPADTVDEERPPIIYHERVFGKILESLGYKCKSLNEAMALVYSNCEVEKFSGIGISFGCGLTNVACSYKGINIFNFSVGRGGDWIDKNVAESTGNQISRVTNLKEKKLDLLGKPSPNRKERIVLEACKYYYENMIEYVLKQISIEFHKNSENLSIDDCIPIVIGGGTSKPNGFLEVFKSVFNGIKNFPYDILEIRRAKNPLEDIAKGCIIKAAWDINKVNKTPDQDTKEVVQTQSELDSGTTLSEDTNINGQ